MRSLTAAAEPEDGNRALDELVDAAAIGAWVVFAIVLFTALAIAGTLFAANKRRRLQHSHDD